MPTFTYKAKDTKGASISGTLEADNHAAASSRLQTMGYFPIAIEGGGDEGGEKSGFTLGGQKVKLRDLCDFYRQLSDLIGAGVPLVKGLGVVKSQTPSPALQAILGQVNSDVQGGDTFAQALEKHPSTFSKFAVALVHAGEAGGLLDETMNRLADFTESQDELRSKIRSALIYPMIVVVVGVLAIGVLMTFVLPRVTSIFDELDQTLPAITELLISMSDGMRDYWYIFVIAILAAVISLRQSLKTPAGARRIHMFMLKAPVLGDMLIKREIASFTRTLGSLLRNGVPILNALKISGEVMSMIPIRDEIEKIPGGITQGGGMAPTLRQCPLFPPVVVNMVAVGEETGELPHVLLRVAQSYETQVERSVGVFAAVLGPVIILALGLVLGFIIIALLLPVFSINPAQGM